MKHLTITILAVLFLPAAALAEDSGFFAGFDTSGGLAFGRSNTTDGGAAFAGGGIVENVKLGETVGIGGHLGYRFNRDLSIFISYEHIRGDASWDARFPLFGIASSFRSTAASNVIMGNVAYDHALSDATVIRGSVGLGVSMNALSDIVETDVATGLFLADVAGHTRISPAASLGAGIQHRISPKATLGLNAALSYTGGFETGDTRSGNLGVTPITPYGIDDVWRADLGISIRLEF